MAGRGAAPALHVIHGGATPSMAAKRGGQADAEVSLLGLELANLTLPEAAAWIAARPASAAFEYVVTPNADHFVRLARDPLVRAVYQGALLRLLDSRVVSGLARLLRLPVPPVVPGSDLTAHLLAHHLAPGERVTIIGLGADWVPALMARERLAEPAHHEPPMGFESDPAAMEAVVAFVRAHPARLVFLAVGSPRQEYLAARLAAADGITGTGLCIGASLDFLAGARRRAPMPMRRLGLEWLFRLACEPRRLAGRYLWRAPAIVGLLLRQWLAYRKLP